MKPEYQETKCSSYQLGPGRLQCSTALLYQNRQAAVWVTGCLGVRSDV